MSEPAPSAPPNPTPPRRRKAVRYLVNTALSFAVNLGLTALLHEAFGVRENIAYGVALVAVFTMNFLLFRYYVFDGRTDRPGRQLGAFLLSSVVFRSVEWAAFNVLTRVGVFGELNERFGFYYLAVIVAVQGTTFVVKYFVYGGWLFKRRPETAAGPGPVADTI